VTSSLLAAVMGRQFRWRKRINEHRSRAGLFRLSHHHHHHHYCRGALSRARYNDGMDTNELVAWRREIAQHTSGVGPLYSFLLCVRRFVREARRLDGPTTPKIDEQNKSGNPPSNTLQMGEARRANKTSSLSDGWSERDPHHHPTCRRNGVGQWPHSDSDQVARHPHTHITKGPETLLFYFFFLAAASRRPWWSHQNGSVKRRKAVRFDDASRNEFGVDDDSHTTTTMTTRNRQQHGE
jgi:hypothetical protein